MTPKDQFDIYLIKSCLCRFAKNLLYGCLWEFATPTYVNAYNSNCKTPTKNCTLPRNSSKCEESNGVIFTWIGEEISLLIWFKVVLFRVAAVMNLATAILTHILSVLLVVLLVVTTLKSQRTSLTSSQSKSDHRLDWN